MGIGMVLVAVVVFLVLLLLMMMVMMIRDDLTGGYGSFVFF